MVVVNQTLIFTYYKIGTIINQKKQWGNKYIQRLASDLKEFGKGYSITNLKYMRQFVDEFTSHEISQQPLPLYLITIQNSSKIPNIFDFLDIQHIKNERDLQRILIENISRFILELGNGFSFVSEKFKLKTTHKTYEIDLLFFHIPTHSYVVIELKTTRFKPEYIGQLLFYTNYIDFFIKTESDSATIGIVLCPEADGFICKTTLMNTKNMAISKYKVLEDLPEYLEVRLKEVK